ncbi:MAG: hypothetical protein R2875_18490 [Desulfobacterales bacterium]
MLNDLGYEVTGLMPMCIHLRYVSGGCASSFLRALMPINLAGRPDLVVVGNAVRRENPKLPAMREMGLNYCSMSQALSHFVVAEKSAAGYRHPRETPPHPCWHGY